MTPILTSALLATLLLTSCSHPRKVAEAPPAPATPTVSSFFLQEEEFRMRDETPIVERRVTTLNPVRQTSSDVSLLREEPDRDIASVPLTQAPLVQEERKWLPWMTLAFGLLLAVALALSVRAARNGPRK
ncbi:MAG: hypothetical protein KF789_02675 [Bdellovibrionaceae bacterium]|nr:hypothetical protein [Pseudobdellovibrionaceae bacterium]